MTTQRIITGDCIDGLRTLPDASVHCCVTSPPYWGLRDYGTGEWQGGDPECDHRASPQQSRSSTLAGNGHGNGKPLSPQLQAMTVPFRGECGKCGAVRVDQQIGLESTPEEYVARMVEVFREVRRVLREDGTCWLNLGDSYARTGGWASNEGLDGCKRGENGRAKTNVQSGRNGQKRPIGLKEKDLVGIPWSVAKALQSPYYSGRIKAERDRVWLAATIDSEGSICGFTHDRKDDGRTRTGLHVTITNSSTLMLDEASRIWPASRYDHQKPRPGHLGKLDTFRWVVQGAENKLTLLRELYPYLITKRRQAIVAYNLLLFVMQGKRNGKLPVKDAVNEKRGELVRVLSAINRQQPVDVPSWCIEPPSLHEPGFYLRQDIIWHKPNPMPESVRDRCTKAHEYVFLMTKSERYYYDAEAVSEAAVTAGESRVTVDHGGGGYQAASMGRKPSGNQIPGTVVVRGPARNRRSVWTISTKPYSGAHFAVMPPDLVEPCILAGCPEQCCPACGRGWKRVVERTDELDDSAKGSTFDGGKTGARCGGDRTQPGPRHKTRSVGWEPACDCAAEGTIPGTVLDPFAGSGTTLAVAAELGRNGIGCELNPEYVKLAEKRIQEARYRVGLLG